MQKAGVVFGKIRSYIWPIYPHELKKLIPMLIMLVCVCLNYSILRNLKDALVVTENGSGAAIIPFIKGWAIFPAAIISTIIFTYLSNRFSRKAVFHIIVSSFLLFFLIYACMLYPNREALQLDQLANYLELILPPGFKAFIGMLRHWPLTGFYVMAELWGSIVLSVLFWSFANEVTTISEAPRFYSVLGIGSNAAAIVAGQLAVYCTNEIFDSSFGFGASSWEHTFIRLIAIVVCSGITMLLAFNWMTRHVIEKELVTEETSVSESKKDRKKLGFRESIATIANSKYLLCIAILVLSYNLVISLVEVIWKDQLRELYPKTTDYNNYLNNLTSLMGIISTTASLFMVGILNKFGWTRTALLTPFVLLVTSSAFFICMLGETSLAPIVITLLGTTPLALSVLLGSIQNCFSKAAKYSLFDTTKEMAFIPLPTDLKLKGKAAIDGIGGRLGKSASSYIHQGLYIIFCSLSASAPYVAVILIAAIGIWMVAVFSLGKQFTKARDTIAISEPTVTNNPATAPQTA